MRAVLRSADSLNIHPFCIGLGADEVLLGEPEELRHADVVDVQAQQGLVAEVLDQQGPLEAMAVACLKFAEIAVVTAVCTLIEVQDRLGRDEVRIVIVVVSCQVEEDRARGGSIGGGGVASLNIISKEASPSRDIQGGLVGGVVELASARL